MALEDKLDDVVTEAMKPIFSTYVANLASGMEAKEAMAKLERGLTILKGAEHDFRVKIREIWQT